MLHFRAVILMSLNKNLYSYHHKIIKAISFIKVCKKRRNEFINLHVHLLVEQRALIKIFKRIMLQFRTMILMSLNKDLYSYHHKIIKAISLIKLCKKDKTNSLIYMYIY